MSATTKKMRIPGESITKEKEWNIFQKIGGLLILFLIFFIWYGIPFFSLILVIWFIGQ